MWQTVSSHCTSGGWVHYQRSDDGDWRIVHSGGVAVVTPYS